MSDELMTKTIIRKLVEKFLEDLIKISAENDPKIKNKNLMDYYIGIEKITQK
ncbi:MAG: hypothetical protein WCY19_05145 [Candidatus Gastranaerophilaceae bacterium]